MIATALLYKETGFNWMPVIPENWETKRAKAIFQERSIKGFPDEPLLAASQKQGVVLKEMLEQRSMEAVQNFESFKLVEKDDFVISLRSFEGGIELAYYRGIISPVYSIFYFRENKHNRDFFKYLFKSRMFIQELNVYKKGIRDGQSISYSEFANIYLPVPPKAEQDEIVQYIKAQEEKINRFIEKKQRFIELLKEQRQSVIDLAITKGTNPNANLIEIGVDWIGKFPQHWQFRKLKFCVSLNSNEIDESEISDEVFKIALENIDNWTGKFIDTGNPQFEGKGVPFKAGDVLFNKLRPYLAKAFIAKSSGFCVGELLVLSPNEDFFTSEFLFQRLMTSDFIDIVNSSTYGAKMPRASWNFIGNLKIPIPPIEEQKQIVEHIKIETANIDTAISKAEREIELIREYKEAMISEAVMGNIKF
jgi:type I restriction enzyme S subunit